jgi:hypothetical protein
MKFETSSRKKYPPLMPTTTLGFCEAISSSGWS